MCWVKFFVDQSSGPESIAQTIRTSYLVWVTNVAII